MDFGRVTDSLLKLGLVMAVAVGFTGCGGEDDLGGDDGSGGAASAAGQGTGGTAVGGATGGGTGGSAGVGMGGVGGGQAGAAGSSGQGSGGAAGASSSACPPQALICEDFESGSFDSKVWVSSTKNGGKVSVTVGSAFEGKYGLQIDLGTASGANGLLQLSSTFPIDKNHFFGRAYVRLSPTEIDSHSYLFAASGKTSAGDKAEYRLDYNKGILNSRYINPAKISQHGGLRKYGPKLQPKSWLCVEWEYDGANNRMKYWFDGKLINEMTVTGGEQPTWVAPKFAAFRIGWHNYQDATNAKAYAVYYDAIALAKNRVGCLKN